MLTAGTAKYSGMNAIRPNRYVRTDQGEKDLRKTAMNQDASIQMVFSSVYWSWAQTDLSRPPKPDSL